VNLRIFLCPLPFAVAVYFLMGTLSRPKKFVKNFFDLFFNGDGSIASNQIPII
jgi:formate-dependent nitrite reductase membrane component NrfD